jgi:F-type H+-transporting ATPase subunit gamma
MANLIDIRRRIRSVRNTQQITKAMKMVSAAKLRRAQDRVIAARPYATTLEAVLVSVASRIPPREDGAPSHPLLQVRPEKNVIVISVTGDKGLAGAFNANVNRATGVFLESLRSRGAASVRLVPLGKKSNDYWRRRRVDIVDARPHLFAGINMALAAEITQGLAARFASGETDAVYILYNEFKSVLSQVVRTKRLLPVELGDVKTQTGGGVDYLYEPAPDVILARLLPRHLEFQMYRVLLETQAAFYAAQMTAMDNASENAGEMIDSLTLTYNRARQARITKELIEIVSGAAALE